MPTDWPLDPSQGGFSEMTMLDQADWVIVESSSSQENDGRGDV